MNVAVICFTINGYILAEKIEAVLASENDNVRVYTKSRYLEGKGVNVNEPLKDWAEKIFASEDAIIFIGAAGICVRTVAPFAESKKYDPAVIVFDEKGKFCIPLLSGHLGGANELALRLCEKLDSVPVLTTATDVNGLFAVDVFAKKNGLMIADMTLAKEVSAALLSGEKVGFISEMPVKGTLPEGLTKEEAELGIYVGIHKDIQKFKKTLYLIPETVYAGIGCKRGTPENNINELVKNVFDEEEIQPEALAGVASCDIKKDEKGLLDFAKSIGKEPVFFSTEELMSLEGDFTSSEFVKSVTGADNVCERAAVLSSHGGRLIHKKTGRGGVTVALALREKEIYFE